MRLLFEWICCDERQKIKDCGINFTDDYRIEFNYGKNELSIQRKASDINSDFYTIGAENIVSQITCLAGKNGSGKTTVLKHLYKTELGEYKFYPIEQQDCHKTVQVYELDGEVKIYHNLHSSIKVFDGNDTYDLPNNVLSDDERITKIFLSNDSFVYLNENASSKANQYKIAITPYDIRLAQSDFLDKICRASNSFYKPNNLFYRFNEYLRWGMNPSYLQNMLYLHFLKCLIESGQANKFPYLKNISVTFLRIDKSDSFIENYGLYSLMFNSVGINELIRGKISEGDLNVIAKLKGISNFDPELLKIFAIVKLAINKCSMGDSSVYANLTVNLTAEILLALSGLNIDICGLTSYAINDLFAMLQKEIKTKEEDLDEGKFDRSELSSIVEYFASAQKSIEMLSKIDSAINNNEQIDIDSNLEFLDFAREEIEQCRFFLFKYLWVRYGCSAGERAFLNLFTWLSFLPYIQNFSNSARNGTNNNILLLIDELDLYCHPEWQRRIIYEIIETLELLYKGKSIHLIFSTHSPLCLSDIPNGNILQLGQTADNQIEIKRMEKLTFGANIFDLYNDGFYLDSFIGEFAHKKIGEAIKTIYDYFCCKDNCEDKIVESKKIADIIGEPVMQKNLMYMINNRRKK